MARPFAWGDWDCNLFAIDLLDILRPAAEPRAQDIRGKYNSRLAAARFQRGYISAPQLFESSGLTLMQVNDKDFRDLDVIFEPTGPYWTMSIRFAGQTWGVREDRGMMVNVVLPGQYLIARNNG